MSRLIWVFAGRTCHFVGFVTMRLIYCRIVLSYKDWMSQKRWFISSFDTWDMFYRRRRLCLSFSNMIVIRCGRQRFYQSSDAEIKIKLEIHMRGCGYVMRLVAHDLGAFAHNVESQTHPHIRMPLPSITGFWYFPYAYPHKSVHISS